MNHMLCLEIKRILKTRRTWLLIVMSLLLSIIMAFLVIFYSQYNYLDKSGNKIASHGFEAIRSKKTMYSSIKGEITEDLLYSIYTAYHKINDEYNGNFPDRISYEQIYPITVLLNRVNEIYVNEDTGIPLSRKDVSAEDASNFYNHRIIRLSKYMEERYEEKPQIQEKAISMANAVKTPFVYVYGVGDSDAMDYLTITIFIVTFVCILIAAPIFSSDYHTGADDILRCTKNGKKTLAYIKMLSMFLISIGLFILSIGVFVLIVNTAFGWDSLITSLQSVRSALSLPSITIGALELLTIISGFISLLSVVCFSLFLSARIKSPTNTLIASIIFMFMPTILGIVGNGTDIENWLRLCLPSSGAGLANSIYYELIEFNFLCIGSFPLWTPYVILLSAAVELVAFFYLAVRAYERHEQ